jgi:glucose-1-phosphate thymidylyltransferase
MKGIILAGGSGTRLYPITLSISKQLIPIYDKPMIYYPLGTLMSAGIRDILIIATPQDAPRFEQLLGSGAQIGCNFTYKIQDKPRGLADAFIVGEDFIGNSPVSLILGDNIFHGSAMGTKLEQFNNPDGGVVFGSQVSDPERYGVVEFDTNMNVVSIEEKPKVPRSSYAIPGLYFFDNHVIEIAKSVKPSARGEIEITEILNEYLRRKKLKVSLLGRGTTWLDTGTFESMNQASQFVQVMEARQGLKIGCIEEIAYLQGFINKEQLEKVAEPFVKSGYGKYLLGIAADPSLERVYRQRQSI